MTVSALGPEACEILCAPFKNEVFISHSPLTFMKVSPPGLHSHVLGVRLPGGGSLRGAWTLLSFGRNSAIVIILPFVCCPPRCMGFYCTASHCSFFMSLVVEDFFC